MRFSRRKESESLPRNVLSGGAIKRKRTLRFAVLILFTREENGEEINHGKREFNY